ncbi:MAG: UDP-N-acetylglucosamine--N-acetylmuramyl-(pentapeptide) pyrophosphoryl-undecaprenol N-acetylglucosamine transferase [Phycisphaerales bacterium JB060]
MTRKAHIGIAFLGGGSGGHIYPALAIADAIERLTPTARAVYITGDRAADEQTLAAQLVFGEPVHRVPLGARPFSVRPRGVLRCVSAWGQAVRQSRAALRDLKTHSESVVAMSTGGYVSAPAALATRAEHVPLVLVGLDARIGKANRLVGGLATHKLVAQDRAPSGWQAAGPIVGRRALAPAPSAECRRMLGLDPQTPTLLVMGGSQGATSINAFMCALCQSHPSELARWQVLHLAGSQQEVADLQSAYQKAGIRARVFERLSPIGPAWGAAELALCRGGAGSVAEAHANTVPAILLPYPYHRDEHQAANAQPLAEAGGMIILKDHVDARANLEAIAPTLLRLLASDAERETMAQNLRRHPRNDGAAACARLLVESAVRP